MPETPQGVLTKKRNNMGNIINEVKELQGIQQKREWLKSFSKIAKVMVQMEGVTVNELLVDKYLEDGATDLRTFKAWKEAGRKVKKGAKAVIVWSRPKKLKAKDRKEGEEEEFKYFGIAHLFDISDTEKITKNGAV